MSWFFFLDFVFSLFNEEIVIIILKKNAGVRLEGRILLYVLKHKRPDCVNVTACIQCEACVVSVSLDSFKVIQKILVTARSSEKHSGPAKNK